MKRYIYILFTIILTFNMIILPVSAIDLSSIDATLEEVDELQSSISELYDHNDELSKDIYEMNQSMTENDAKIAELNIQLHSQKSDMEERLRVMYMFGFADYLQLLFSSKSMSDLFVKLSYVSSIAEADHNALAQLEETKKEIESKKRENKKSLKTLQDDQKQLEANIKTLEEKKAEKDALLEDQRVALAYQQKQAEREAAAKKASQESEISSDSGSSGGHESSSSGSSSDSGGSSSSGSSSGSGGSSSYSCATLTDAEFELVCAIVRHEGGASYEGSLAVMTCVMNRCAVGGWYGDDPVEVLTKPYQFESYGGGYYLQFMGNCSEDISYTRQAVKDCIESGVRSHPYLSFRSYYDSSIMGSDYRCIRGNFFFKSM